MSTRWKRLPEDDLPDARDGLTRLERVILYVLHEAEREFPSGRVPATLLYGRVVEYLNVGQAEFSQTLVRLTGRSY